MLARSSYLSLLCLGPLLACKGGSFNVITTNETVDAGSHKKAEKGATGASVPEASSVAPTLQADAGAGKVGPEPVSSDLVNLGPPKPSPSDEPGPTFVGVVASGAPTASEPSEPMPCGNSEVGTGESCDDSNSKAGDGCSEKCQLEAGFECSAPGRPCVALCGNGRLDTDEVCDDRNAVAKDGCSADCKLEKGYECLSVGEACRKVVCGDGVLGLNEACDDKNTASKDGCAGDCSAIETDFACPTAGAACINIALCGNGGRETGEECDLGPANKNTGECTLACRKPTCGDGFVQSGEQCDDARLSGAYGTCAKGCVLAPYCGDGSVQSSVEACDLGKSSNTGAYGGCNANCTRAPRCGDGLVQSGEECDDGDTSDINGCTNVCRFTSGLRIWYPFNDGSGSAVKDFTTGNDTDVKLGRDEAKAAAYTGAFRSGNGSQGGYVTLTRISGDDPSETDEAVTNPLSWVDLRKQLPNGRTATISLWTRKASRTSGRQTLAYFGSDGNGYGGLSTSSDGTQIAPNHEIWLMLDDDSQSDTTYRLVFGTTPSYDLPAASKWIPKPSGDLAVHDVDSCNIAATLAFGAWHHVVMTFKNLQNPDDKTTPKQVTELGYYINGQVVSNKTGCYSVNLDRFLEGYLGRSGAQDNSVSWRGDIDNFMMFDRILTASEITDLFQMQKP